jgi:hypothetical protein
VKKALLSKGGLEVYGGSAAAYGTVVGGSDYPYGKVRVTSGGIANSVATYKKGEVMDVLTRGSIVVECTSGTVKPGMPVYFNKMVGAASATSSDLTITVPGVNFRSTRDGSGRAEILVKERHLI